MQLLYESIVTSFLNVVCVVLCCLKNKIAYHLLSRAKEIWLLFFISISILYKALIISMLHKMVYYTKLYLWYIIQKLLDKYKNHDTIYI